MENWRTEHHTKKPSFRSRRAVLIGLGTWGGSIILGGQPSPATQGKFITLGHHTQLEMVTIPGGSFLMGAATAEKYSKMDERPQHRVTVPAFQMGRYPVTQRQWQMVMGNNPAHFPGDNLPVEQVTWQQSIEFCQKLSALTGQTYRLPSEAEWEYACRAGTTTPYHFGKSASRRVANYYAYDASRPRQTSMVGSYSANAFGLYDMHGNVEEWCADEFHHSYDGAPTNGSAWADGNSHSHVVRGGSWVINPGCCRSANRDFSNAAASYIGLRVACG
jgi:formylglycine-generating enzyme required for sulfatase activity